MIEEFRGEYGFLSNFYPSPLEYDGVEYPTAEHAFQAAKTDVPVHKRQIAKAKSAVVAKHLGKMVTLRPGWEEVRDEVMLEVLRCKFRDNAELADRLVATGKERLVEGNKWDDTYWGMSGGVGENKLGKLLMRVRKEIIKERRKEGD